jgi:hypothetical protein
VVKAYYDKKNSRMQQTATSASPDRAAAPRPLVATVGGQP